MLIAGEASGDLLGAELVRALRKEFATLPAVYTDDQQPLTTPLEPRFIGAGGPLMKAAGVELEDDFTAHSIIGLWEVLGSAMTFRRFFYRLFRLALERQPDVVVFIDFGGFNLRLAHKIRKYVRGHADWFHRWQPKLVQVVSPQVWGSRANRAYRIADDYDLLLSTVPFEKKWYSRRVPKLPVVFIGNPIVDRYAGYRMGSRETMTPLATTGEAGKVIERTPKVALFPGSRIGEVRRHVPLLMAVARQMNFVRPCEFTMVLPNEMLMRESQDLLKDFSAIRLQVRDLGEALNRSDLAITKSGTVTLECAWFEVPAIVFYKTSFVTYLAARTLARVKYLAMPNLIADEMLFPEFLQYSASPETIAGAALNLLRDEARRKYVRQKLAEVVQTLGEPGVMERAAQIIIRLRYSGKNAIQAAAAREFVEGISL